MLDIWAINHKNVLVHKIEWYITNLFSHGGNAYHCHGINEKYLGLTEAVSRRISVKSVFLKISEIYKKTPMPEFLF